MKLLTKIKNKITGGIAMMINFFAMQFQQGWITLEQVPKRYRAKVKELLDLADIGVEGEEKGKE